MGGELRVKSAVNQGSTFWFDLMLPVVAEDQVTTDLQRNPIVGFRGKLQKVLVVDDHWENRIVLVNLLLSVGFEVREARNGGEALQTAATWKPDVILLDMLMPEMDGYTATQKIRNSKSEIRNIPIVAVSASMLEDLQREAGAAGCDDFIGKPVQADELFEKLGRLLSIEWLYEEPSTDASPNTAGPLSLASRADRDGAAGLPGDMLVIPSSSALNKLDGLAADGDFLGIRQYLDQLEHADQCYHRFASIIRQFAKRFQDNDIRAFIHTIKEENHE
jgi:CheY-like chemotaxis protein